MRDEEMMQFNNTQEYDETAKRIASNHILTKWRVFIVTFSSRYERSKQPQYPPITNSQRSLGTS